MSVWRIDEFSRAAVPENAVEKVTRYSICPRSELRELLATFADT